MRKLTILTLIFACTLSVNAKSKVLVEWYYPGDINKVDHFNLYYSSTQDTAQANIKKIKPSDTATFFDGTFTAGETYYFWITAERRKVEGDLSPIRKIEFPFKPKTITKFSVKIVEE